MKISKQSIKEFLIQNKLIRGRINLNVDEIQKIYQRRYREIEKIRKTISNNEKNIDSILAEIKKLRSHLKYCEETINKAFYPSIENISLIYKKSGKHCYIKARFYWEGNQREVQVGTFAIVLRNIHLLMESGYLKFMQLPDVDTMTWSKFIKNNTLILATKQISALKFQEYILRKISNKENSELSNSVDNTINTFKDSDRLNISKVKDDKISWYEKWRTENL